MLSLLLFLSSFVILISAQLEIRACCGGIGGTCSSFTRPEDLFGTACCGNVPYNSYTELCCSGAVRERRKGGSFAELCCGTEVLRYDQTCCDGVVHNVVNGDCCGKAVFIKADRTFLCCNGTLTRTASQTDICCGADVFDGGRNQICCGNNVYEKTSFDSCCEKNDGTLSPYNMTTQFCCNGTEQKGSNRSCCYLRKAGKVVPEAYNTNGQCCRYPYDMLYSANIDGSCSP